MSFRGGGGMMMGGADHPQVQAAVFEMKTMSDLYAKMSASCFKKCILSFKEPAELNVGEMSCTDRCVAKYMAAQEAIGKRLQEAQQTMQPQ